ncbi:Uncharacterised protein [Candidatus Tiddalikarchaeum anstoanum]|nr:Uncharacterised protein [Candidatus Tiddalikarchaeum anstoanum]
MVDFEALINTGEYPLGKLGIKNKGSIVKLGPYYINMYTLLIEKFGLKVQETTYITTDNGDGSEKRYWEWVAYKNIDTFSRIKFKLGNNAYRIVGDKVMGIFAPSYTFEIDYKKTWRNNSILSRFLFIYLKWWYWPRVLLPLVIRYIEELQAIKEVVKKELNVSVYD